MRPPAHRGLRLRPGGKWEFGSRKWECGSRKWEGGPVVVPKKKRDYAAAGMRPSTSPDEPKVEVGMLPAEGENRNKNRKDSDSNSAFRIPHSAFKGVPIIAITASAFSEQRQEIMAAGCNDMVTKPFQAHEIFEAMARFLDIEYIYETKGEAASDRLGGTDLTSAMLADLPTELLQELREATLTLNSEAITAVIERIEPLDPDTAKDLQTLMDDFQIGRIHDLLGEVEG